LQTVDPDIEQTAQAWANRCQFVHSHTPGLGENIYYYTEQLPEG
jgi:hypothetical protein